MALKYTRLTRAECRKLRAGEKLNEHGISFEKLANGDGRFTINIMVDGTRIHRVVGLESTGVTREQCEDFIQKVRTEARQDRLALPKGRKLTMNFGMAAEQYLKRLESSGGKDIQNKRSILIHHLVPYFGTRALVKITALDVERYKKTRGQECSLRGGDRRSHKADLAGATKKPVAPATIQRELAVLSHLLSSAEDWGWIPAKPRVKGMKLDNARLTYLTQEQVNRLLEAAEHDASFEIYPYLLIAFGTSMRMMEILRIRIQDIDLDRRLIHVPVAKAGGRDQPFAPSVADYLAERLPQIPKDQVWLFPSHRKDSLHPHMTNIKKPFRRVVIAAGLDPSAVVRHTTRHTAITHLVQGGIDLPTVARISAHSDIKMVARYAHQNSEHLQSAMDRLDGRYQEGSPSVPKNRNED